MREFFDTVLARDAGQVLARSIIAGVVSRTGKHEVDAVAPRVQTRTSLAGSQSSRFEVCVCAFTMLAS